jgi:hypothetical protein
VLRVFWAIGVVGFAGVRSETGFFFDLGLFLGD